MSILDSILGRPASQTPAAPAPAPAAPVQQTPTEPVNPLDSYKAMLENANKPAEPSDTPSFSLDGKVLDEVGGKLNFTQGVNPDLLQKATGGDAGAMVALMNTVAQNAYKAALQHNTALTDTHLNTRAEHEKKLVDGAVKSSLISNELASVPNANHPVVKQELVRIAQALAKENPDATPSQIKEEAVRYLNTVYSALNPKQQDTPSQTQTAGQVQDWEAFLNG